MTPLDVSFKQEVLKYGDVNLLRLATQLTIFSKENRYDAIMNSVAGSLVLIAPIGLFHTGPVLGFRCVEVLEVKYPYFAKDTGPKVIRSQDLEILNDRLAQMEWM